MEISTSHIATLGISAALAYTASSLLGNWQNSNLKNQQKSEQKSEPTVQRNASLMELRNQLNQTKVTGVDHIEHLSTAYSTEVLSNADHIAKMNSQGQLGLFQSPLIGNNLVKDIFGGAGFLPREAFVLDEYFVTASNEYSSYWDIAQAVKFVKAGPRAEIFHNPDKTRVCIVTCGGLCPGLNVVIRELFMTLHFNYAVQKVYGVKWGYKGFYTDQDHWIELTVDFVKNIHKEGGTILGSSRGGFDADKILDALVSRQITQCYIIGGDGTHRGIIVLQKRAIERNIVISFIGVPKTIDNDIPLIDYSFGYHTSVEVASKMVEAANIQSKSVMNGVGLVKLMGRASGFIAMEASLANNSVDFCLIPELPFELNGPNGLFEQVLKRVKIQGHCLVVVAEGAEDGLILEEEKKALENGDLKDPSGNPIRQDIGIFLQTKISEFERSKNFSVDVSLIDPTYAIRSVAANPGDTLLCTNLAQNAVHGGMYGFTGFTVGNIRNSLCYIPVTTMNEAGTNKVNLSARPWQRMLAANNQPEFLNAENLEKARQHVLKADVERQKAISKIQTRLFELKQKVKAAEEEQLQ